MHNFFLQLHANMFLKGFKVFLFVDAATKLGFQNSKNVAKLISI